MLKNDFYVSMFGWLRSPKTILLSRPRAFAEQAVAAAENICEYNTIIAR
jgi:hypothetical protein